MEIPIAGFFFEPISSISFNGDLEGTFYLDDFRFIAAETPMTAILEERAATLPQSFALEQNYPNPFNSETVIRFALPQRVEIDLQLFNLAGQKVATLARGHRAAGLYTLRWDGRDEAGRKLASGTYLYRLRAGAEVATRKLLLLR